MLARTQYSSIKNALKPEPYLIFNFIRDPIIQASYQIRSQDKPLHLHVVLLVTCKLSPIILLLWLRWIIGTSENRICGRQVLCCYYHNLPVVEKNLPFFLYFWFLSSHFPSHKTTAHQTKKSFYKMTSISSINIFQLFL